VGLRPSYSAHVRLGERGAPLWSCGARSRLEGKTCGIPHLAKKERDVRHPAIVAGMESKGRFIPPGDWVGDGDEKLFDVGGGFLETMEGCRVVLDPELGAALLQVGLHRRATRQRLLLIRLIFRRPGRGPLRRIMP